MKNKIFGMLATIMMGGAVMTGLTACSNTDINDGVKYIVLTTVDYKKINESGLPITGTQTVAGIPTVYSKITVITKDDL